MLFAADASCSAEEDTIIMDGKRKLVPVTVTMRVTCGCGHAEDETYEFDMPAHQAQPMKTCEPGTCPKCGAPVRIDLRRTMSLQ
jgi:hypothetical protein